MGKLSSIHATANTIGNHGDNDQPLRSRMDVHGRDIYHNGECNFFVTASNRASSPHQDPGPLNDRPNQERGHCSSRHNALQISAARAAEAEAAHAACRLRDSNSTSQAAGTGAAAPNLVEHGLPELLQLRTQHLLSSRHELFAELREILPQTLSQGPPPAPFSSSPFSPSSLRSSQHTYLS